jgi:ELWxxDGT repeat protein
VKDINPATRDVSFDNLTMIGPTLFFTANDGPCGLWRSDGTPAGTQLVKTIGPIEADVWPRNLSVAANTLFFTADDALSGAELWRSDGTTVGTRLVEDIQPGALGSNPGPVAVSGGYLFARHVRLQLAPSCRPFAPAPASTPMSGRQMPTSPHQAVWARSSSAMLIVGSRLQAV